MDLRIVLNRLGFVEDPCSDFSSYEAMMTFWFDDTVPIPTEAVVIAEWDAYLAEQAAIQHLKDREEALREQLPDTVYLPAMLEQAKADRAAGKTLCAELEDAVNIYTQILIDILPPPPSDSE